MKTQKIGYARVSTVDQNLERQLDILRRGAIIIKILLVKAGCKPVVRTIDGTLESMQAMVDGLIAVLYPFDDEVALVRNEEGKLRGLPQNNLFHDYVESFTVCCIL